MGPGIYGPSTHYFSIFYHLNRKIANIFYRLNRKIAKFKLMYNQRREREVNFGGETAGHLVPPPKNKTKHY